MRVMNWFPIHPCGLSFYDLWFSTDNDFAKSEKLNVPVEDQENIYLIEKLQFNPSKYVQIWQFRTRNLPSVSFVIHIFIYVRSFDLRLGLLKNRTMQIFCTTAKQTVVVVKRLACTTVKNSYCSTYSTIWVHKWKRKSEKKWRKCCSGVPVFRRSGVQTFRCSGVLRIIAWSL